MRVEPTAWRGIKIAAFITCLSPFLWLCLDIWQDNLGANPIQTIHFRLGDWALRFLCLTLLATPYRQLTGQSWPSRFRRMLGLFSFFYASLHFLVFIVLDISLSWEAFVDEIKDSPYILFGLATFILLLPLALTSSKSMQKRLGKNWKRLHSLIYLAAITAVLHYILLVKSDLTEPLIYADIILILLVYRLFKITKKRNILLNRA